MRSFTDGTMEDSTVRKGVMFNKDGTHPKIKRRIKKVNDVPDHKNYRSKARRLIRQTAAQGGTNVGGSERRAIRGKGNDDAVKYWALRSGDDRDATEAKAGNSAPVKHPRCKEVLDTKQWNDGLRNILATLNDEIVVKGAKGVQNLVDSCKETAGAGRETPGMEVMKTLAQMANRDSGTMVPRQGLQQIKTVAGAPLTRAHKPGIAGTQREAAVAEGMEEMGQGREEQGPQRSRASGSLQRQGPTGVKEQETPGLSASMSLQQQRPSGAKEQGARAAGVESFQELGERIMSTSTLASLGNSTRASPPPQVT